MQLEAGLLLLFGLYAHGLTFRSSCLRLLLFLLCLLLATFFPCLPHFLTNSMSFLDKFGRRFLLDDMRLQKFFLFLDISSMNLLGYDRGGGWSLLLLAGLLLRR